jgi:two-component system, CAI-1 autoinducer sensor kinase/phosphatase CqsS
MNILRELFEHYRAYHAYGPPRLKYMGYVGAISVALFYLLRFTRPNPQLSDDLVLRFIAFVLFTFLALKDRWPEKAKPYYIGYSYLVLLYCLPCFTVLVALQRGGGMPAISHAFIVLCFLVLLTDWRNTLVMLIAGTGIAVAVYVATDPNPKLPMDLVAQLPAFALIVIGGNLFKFSTEQIDAERKLRATQPLRDPLPTKCATRSARSGTTWKACSKPCRRRRPRRRPRHWGRPTSTPCTGIWRKVKWPSSAACR